MTDGKYNVVIVDDEFLARKLLQDYVSKVDSLNLVASCSSAIEATEVLNNNAVDILFLDIQMPDITGLEFVKSMKKMPAVIFTTAYSEYAIDAFDLGVVDYLLKPFDFPRFFQSISKVMGKTAKEEGIDNSDIRDIKDVNNTADYLIVKADYKLYKIDYDDLLFIEGQHEYVTFHTKQRRITALFALKDLEEILPADKFIRVHKSYIVSFKQIQDLDKTQLTVAGEKIPIGGNYRDALMERFHLSES